MFKNIFNLLFNKVQNEQYGLDNLDDDVIGYPPTPRGIPVVKPSVLKNKMEGDVQFIKNELGLSDSDFEQYVRPVTDMFINFADLLPASEYKHHSTGGGLIYHSFDVAKRCVRASQLTQYPVTDVSQAKTQQSNKHWKTATVLTGLLHDSGKIVTDVIVSNGDEESPIIWDVYSGLPLFEWAKENKIDRYFITYRKQRHAKHHNASVTMLQRIIPKETWSWLLGCEDGRAVHSAMLDCVSKSNTTHPLCEAVNYCDAESVKFDMLHRHSHMSKEVKKTPLSELLADLIKHHILKGEWTINQKGAKLWFINDVTYVLWEGCAPDLASELLGAGYNIPQSPDVLARICIEEGMCEAFDVDNLYHELKPEILGSKAKPVKLNALKFKRTARIIPHPDKLYSIQEHTGYKSAVTNENQAVAVHDSPDTTNVDDSELPPPPPQSDTNGFEPAMVSLSKIAKFIKATLKQDEVLIPTQLTSSSSTEDSADTVNPNSESNTAQPEPEVQSEQPEESEKPKQHDNLDDCQVVQFEQPELKMLVELGCPVMDGKIIIRKPDETRLSNEMKEHFGYSPFFNVQKLVDQYEAVVNE